MHPTPRLFNFWGRSMDVVRRQANILIKQEYLRGPTGPLHLATFNSPSSCSVKLISDQEFGGLSTSLVSHIPAASDNPAHIRWHGTISTTLPKTRFPVKRCGFAAFRTQDQKLNLFGYGKWDLSPYHYVALRIKSDGRGYFVNLIAESIAPQDIFQHRLWCKRVGEWETIMIPLSDFMRTSHGMAVEPQGPMIEEKVLTVGISCLDRKDGPFNLDIQGIWATNGEEEALAAKEESDRLSEVNGLKNKKGEEVRWKAE